MNIRRKIYFATFLCAIVVTFAIVVYRPAAQQTYQVYPVDKNTPITDFKASLPTDPVERAKREKRSKKRNVKDEFGREPVDIWKFALTEERNSGYGGFHSESPEEPAIPVVSSHAIIIGTISNPKAFLTADKVGVYSEFDFTVSEVLKNQTGRINQKDKITISRPGGAVRFPSGKLIEMYFNGKPMPENGGKYLMFLRYDGETDEYPIITGYQLKDGIVVPLDGIRKDGTTPWQLESHRTYVGTSEATFLKIVRDAINRGVDEFEQGRVK
jgi:hypothetical protein